MKYSSPFNLNTFEIKQNYSKILSNPLNKSEININQNVIKPSNDDILFPTEVEAYLNVIH